MRQQIKQITELPGWQHMAGGIGVAAVVAFYNSLFAFSFFPLTEGWFSAYAHLILDGKVPYRDFYLYLTPLYPMLMAAIVGIFGDTFFVLRLIGVFIIIAIAILLYLILRLFFRPSSSMVATIAATVYYQSGVAHIPYDFTQVLTLFTLASTLMLCRAAEGAKNINQGQPWINSVSRQVLLAGVFASLAFLTKQSNGAFVVVAASIGMGYIALLMGRKGVKVATVFVVGCLIPVILFAGWLAYTDALVPFGEQIFGGALSAKGSLGHVIFAWFKGLLTNVFLIQMETVGKWAAITIVLSVFLTVVLSFIDKPITTGRGMLALLISLAILCMAVVMNAYWGSTILAAKVSEFGTQANNYIIPVATSLAAALILLGFVSGFLPRTRKYISSSLIILGIMSVGMIWGNGTSAGLSEVGVFAMFALTLAGLMDLRPFRYAGFAAGMLLLVSLVFMFATRKFDAPYSWWGVAEPGVQQARFSSDVPIAKGLRMSQETADNLNAIAASLSRGSKSGDIFAFPNIPLVYLIANRWPNSKVVVPWFDFLPDAPAKAEAVRLLAHPPETIVNLKLPAVAWDAHERLFRGGKPLGQRDIQTAITELTEKQKLYRLDFSREVSPGCVLEVWNKARINHVQL